MARQRKETIEDAEARTVELLLAIIEEIPVERQRQLCRELNQRRLFDSAGYAVELISTIETLGNIKTVTTDAIDRVARAGWEQYADQAKRLDKHRRKLDPEILAKIRELRDQGYSWKEVGKELGMSPNAARLRDYHARLQGK
jgi:hypothetical protein